MPYHAYDGDKDPLVGGADSGREPGFDPCDFDAMLQEAFFDQLRADHPDENWEPSYEAAIAMLRQEPIDGSPLPLPEAVAHPSALSSLPPSLLEDASFIPLGALSDMDPPRIGDVMVAEVESCGEHSELEDGFGRIGLRLAAGTKLLCVYANRYAELSYEGKVPAEYTDRVDLLSRSGVIGLVTRQHQTNVKDPTRLRVLGRVIDNEGRPVSTMKNIQRLPSNPKLFPRSKMILVLGGSIEVGDGSCAAAICRGLTTQRYRVKASRVTGMASARDLRLMKDAGATEFEDSTKQGYPSTADVSRQELLDLFERLDDACGSDPDDIWVAEFADSILQPETYALLSEPAVVDRIHKIVLCAMDAVGALGAIDVLNELGLRPDAIAGPIGHAPLAVEQLGYRSDIPVINDEDPGDIGMKDFIRDLASPEWGGR